MVGSFIQDDLDTTFFAASDFGAAEGDLTYKGVTISGIFDYEDIEVQTGEGVTQIISQPTVTTSESQVPSVEEDDAVVASGTNYVVKNWKRDGTGEITLYLELA